MSFRSLLNKTCLVRSRTSLSDTGYGFTSEWSDLYSDLRCALQPLGGEESVRLYGAEKVESTHVLYVEPEYEIETEWQVVIDGETYDVQDDRDDAGRGHHRKVMLRIVKDL